MFPVRELHRVRHVVHLSITPHTLLSCVEAEVEMEMGRDEGGGEGRAGKNEKSKTCKMPDDGCSISLFFPQ